MWIIDGREPSVIMRNVRDRKILGFLLVLFFSHNEYFSHCFHERKSNLISRTTLISCILVIIVFPILRSRCYNLVVI